MTLDEGWKAYLDAASRELAGAGAHAPSSFPHYSENGRWVKLPVATRSRWNGETYEHGNWTAGFWFGVMWLLALGKASANSAQAARGRLAALAERADDATTHDLGFLFYPSFVLGQSAGFLDSAAAEPALRAARTLAKRFNPRGRYLQAFGALGDARSAGTSTIDTMMNLPLLWWAHARTGETALADVARAHALTSTGAFVREDGSTSHLNQFDPRSGALVSRGTFQGAGSQSCWSRGQAWAICGFAWTYAITRELETLSAAERTAAYFWQRLPSDGLVPWDFSDNTADAAHDASASAIAALGVLVLGAVHPDDAARRRYVDDGDRLLRALCAHALNRGPRSDGILLHSCYSKPHNLGVNGATAWGDFFFGLVLAFATGRITLDTMLGQTRKAEA